MSASVNEDGVTQSSERTRSKCPHALLPPLSMPSMMCQVSWSKIKALLPSHTNKNEYNDKDHQKAHRPCTKWMGIVPGKERKQLV